ncbi:MAG: hypothetical protein ACXABD_11915, partial [Candidatus Thorarchaeota archaeon]
MGFFFLRSHGGLGSAVSLLGGSARGSTNTRSSSAGGITTGVPGSGGGRAAGGLVPSRTAARRCSAR